MKNKLFFITLSFILVFSISLFSQLKVENFKKYRIYLANVIMGQGVDTSLLNANKVKPALHFITTQLTFKYELIPNNEINAAILKLKNPTTFEVGRFCNADFVFIIKIEQLYNIIRAEIITANPNCPDSAFSHSGLGVLHIFKSESGMPMFDPTLLVAIQRAFAGAVRDSNMFMFHSPPYNVKPVPSLIVSSIEFIDNPQFAFWDVFNNPTITSYDFIETIYEEIYNTSEWVVFDINSRDAIYSLFNLVLIENNVPPSYAELDAMRRFGVEHYITGVIERNQNGIKMTLFMKENNVNAVTLSQNKVIKSVEMNIYQNDLFATRIAIKNLAKRLIFE